MSASEKNRSRRRVERLSRSGVSLVELLVAMLVITVGMLGMAAGTSWTIRAVEIARLDTERAAVLQSAIEQVKAVPFANVAAGNVVQGSYTVTWTVLAADANSRNMRFILEGPGRTPGTYGIQPVISLVARDTLDYRISRP